MQILAHFPGRQLAEAAAACLQDAGIIAALMIDERDAPSLSDPAAAVRLAVRDSDAERAAEVLRAHDLLPQE